MNNEGTSIVTMQVSEEKLSHFRCLSCKGWWTIGDAGNKKTWYCPWCGVKHEQ